MNLPQLEHHLYEAGNTSENHKNRIKMISEDISMNIRDPYCGHSGHVIKVYMSTYSGVRFRIIKSHFM